MTISEAVLASEEMTEILHAARDTLDYALSQSRALTVADDPANEVQGSIERALRSMTSAGAKQQSVLATKGYAANALARLRSALRAIQEMDDLDEKVLLTGRATARAISLIYPLTQSEGPLLLVPRKSRGSRRQSKVQGQRRRRSHPMFNVVVGCESTFFTGFVGDIASGGLFIATYDIYPVDSKLTVSAELAADRIIMGTAKVGWIREHNPACPELLPGMGVIFQNLTRAAEYEINQYLNENESIFYEAV